MYPPQSPRHRQRAERRPAALAFALATALAGTVHAAGTSPVLALTAADVAMTQSGIRVASAEGAFNFDDLVQVAFPAAGLLVVRGDRFVRYEVDGTVVEGTSAAVKNGVTPDELASVLQISGAPVGPARLVQVAASSVSVVLPSDLTPGPALVLLYAHHEDEHFVSNAIPVVLP